MFANLGTTELIIIGVVILVLFGAKFLPKMGKNLGESKVEFKKATKDLKEAIKDKE
ncbi:MAG: twin-arginine translocase TatA/TatE family subunit [Patescibacteria group bacterium]